MSFNPLLPYGLVVNDPEFSDLIELSSKAYTRAVLDTPSAEDGQPTHYLVTEITATLRNGDQYRKQFSYDDYGAVASETRWTLVSGIGKVIGLFPYTLTYSSSGSPPPPSSRLLKPIGLFPYSLTYSSTGSPTPPPSGPALGTPIGIFPYTITYSSGGSPPTPPAARTPVGVFPYTITYP